MGSEAAPEPELVPELCVPPHPVEVKILDLLSPNDQVVWSAMNDSSSYVKEVVAPVGVASISGAEAACQ